MARKLFCELSPFCYRISVEKEILRRNVRDLFSAVRFAERRNPELLPILLKGHRSPMLRELNGVDMQLQYNKETNLRLAGERINGLTVAPGETFSFWHTVGRTTAKKGYLTGLTIGAGKLGAEIGGGLCQLANLIHWMVLNSPLTVTELHHHTDALFPDSGRRVPFGTGTSIFYKNVDYRFRNDTDTSVQLLIWQEGHDLCGELRAERRFPYRWRIVEEDHHFQREADGNYYRCSRIYRIKTDCNGNELDRELLLVNHSKVMYDPSLIPPEQLREALSC